MKGSKEPGGARLCRLAFLYLQVVSSPAPSTAHTGAAGTGFGVHLPFFFQNSSRDKEQGKNIMERDMEDTVPNPALGLL